MVLRYRGLWKSSIRRPNLPFEVWLLVRIPNRYECRSIVKFISQCRLIQMPEPPEVTFQLLPNRPIPMHPHVYSNGYICLDLLSSQGGWSPVQNVVSICVSIQSMLTGNTKAERPEGDALFVLNNTKRPRDVSYAYHEDV